MTRGRTRSRGRRRSVTAGRALPLVLLVAAVVVAGAVPTTSFSTVETERSGTVGVSGDATAALGLAVSPTVSANVQEPLVVLENNFGTGTAVVTVTLTDPGTGTLYAPGSSGDSVTVTLAQGATGTVDVQAAASPGPFTFEVTALVGGETTATLVRQSVVNLGQVPVDVDVKPGSSTNPINPNSQGVIPVAILHTPEFDPTTEVDVGTLRFGAPGVVDGGAGAAPAHGGHHEDVDGDGDLDLVLHFPTQDTGFGPADDTAKLTGETTDGTTIAGTDSVTIVGGGGGPGSDDGDEDGDDADEEEDEEDGDAEEADEEDEDDADEEDEDDGDGDDDDGEDD